MSNFLPMPVHRGCASSLPTVAVWPAGVRSPATQHGLLPLIDPDSFDSLFLQLLICKDNHKRPQAEAAQVG